MYRIHLLLRCRDDEQIQRENNPKCRRSHDDAEGVLQAVRINDRKHNYRQNGPARDGGGEVDGAGFGEGTEAAEGDGEEQREDARLKELAENDHGDARSFGKVHGQGGCDDHANDEGQQHVAGLDEGIEEGAEETSGCEDRVSDDLVIEGTDDGAAEI